MTERSRRRALARLARLLGGQKLETTPEVLACYAFDATNIRCRPFAVAFPEGTADIQVLMRMCEEAELPVIPRGAGTGFAGGTVPLHGGVVISTERLARIISVERDGRLAVVEPGVVNARLQAEAGKVGLMFPPDPSSLGVSTLGGNVAQDAGGPRALKYGVTRDYVLGVDAVLAGGHLVESNWRNAGWDPVSILLVGSEGTLGFITRIYLRLVAKPEAFATVLAFFESTHDAAAAVNRIFAAGVLPAAVELIDADTMASITSFARLDVPNRAGCSLLVETDGEAVEAREMMAAVEEAIKAERPVELRLAASEIERQELWRMRRAVSPALARIAPWKINEDVCVPRSNLPALVDAVRLLGQKHSLRVPTFGHAGDGNLHVNIMFDTRDKDQVRRAEALAADLFEATLRLSGSISGEHGIGLTKMPYLAGQLGPDVIRLSEHIKHVFDPRGIVNPGKVIGDA